MQMVHPIIELAKKNIDYNAKKNEKFGDLNLKLESILRETGNINREIFELKKMPRDIANIDKTVQVTRVETKGKLDA